SHTNCVLTKEFTFILVLLLHAADDQGTGLNANLVGLNNPSYSPTTNVFGLFVQGLFLQESSCFNECLRFAFLLNRKANCQATKQYNHNDKIDRSAQIHQQCSFLFHGYSYQFFFTN